MTPNRILGAEGQPLKALARVRSRDALRDAVIQDWRWSARDIVAGNAAWDDGQTNNDHDRANDRTLPGNPKSLLDVQDTDEDDDL